MFKLFVSSFMVAVSAFAVYICTIAALNIRHDVVGWEIAQGGIVFLGAIYILIGATFLYVAIQRNA